MIRYSILSRRGMIGGLPAMIALLASALAVPAGAQSLKSVRIAAKPLVLKSRGSFFIGGEPAEATAAELGLGPDDRVTVNQMYVEFMVPSGRAKVPVVLIHGAGLSGKSYDTTPDGRMGWFEYFVRKSHPTYVIDQVGRARSGFNHITLNRRLAGAVAPAGTTTAAIPTGVTGASSVPAFRFGERKGVWTNFRIGPQYGQAFPGSQFPTEAIDELAKQAIPDLTSLVPSPNPTFKALADLATETNGAVLLSHSQSGPFPMDAALIDPTGIRGIVAVEPGQCRSTYADEEMGRLAKIPTLVLFGDNLPAPTQVGNLTWQRRYEGCLTYAGRIKAAGGKIEVLRTTDLGMRGNTHMMMQDRNSDDIADFILKWIDANAGS